MIPKTEKMYQINTKCTKWSKWIPNFHKIFQMAITYINIHPNWDFWFENKPSGNPGIDILVILPFLHMGTSVMVKPVE
jgi:hypothetical protein